MTIHIGPKAVVVIAAGWALYQWVRAPSPMFCFTPARVPRERP